MKHEQISELAEAKAMRAAARKYAYSSDAAKIDKEMDLYRSAVVLVTRMMAISEDKKKPQK